MLRINDHKMDLDLTALGFIRQGKVYCPTCGGSHDVQASLKLREAHVLTGRQGEGKVCDCCGVQLDRVSAVV